MTWPNYFQSFELIQLVSVFWLYLIHYNYTSLYWLLCYSLHISCGRWKKVLPITSHRIWLVMIRPHEKYTGNVYPYIYGIFIYSGRHTANLLTNNRTWFGMKLFISCAEVIIICICFAVQRGTSATTHGYHMLAVNEDNSDNMSQEETFKFHHVTENML